MWDFDLRSLDFAELTIFAFSQSFQLSIGDTVIRTRGNIFQVDLTVFDRVEEIRMYNFLNYNIDTILELKVESNAKR